MTSFHSKREALEFYSKEYPNVPKHFIELAIDYDIYEQERITQDIEALKIIQARKEVESDASMRSSKIKDRLKKKFNEKNLTIEQSKSCIPIEFT